MSRMDFDCVGGRPSRARVRSYFTREGDGDKTVITMNPNNDSRRRYSDSEEKSTRQHIPPGLEEISNLVRMHSCVLGQSAPCLSTHMYM
ncbi:hypothetical protein L798_15625 [Zootermopsis nevadensis]|uniref:Uncharacterized protein n=1 Tax=Zootermopsis nevadensis TaxID=136037 RepID=A0A067QKN0_ZOONE|nr:hypothetical protein L798_15625 [Zootermopsis nevadensis]